MAGGMDPGASNKGGRKALDATINLVPFIDLMAVTISFLIMTAVWTQIGRLQVSSAGGAPGETTAEETLPVTLLISERGLRLTVGGAVLEPMPFVRDAKGRLDLARLRSRIADLRDGKPNQQAITLQTEDSVRYDDLVRIIDECIGDGLSAVQVSPTAT